MRINFTFPFVFSVCFLFSVPFNAYATLYNYLESPSLVGQMAGPDLLWDTADDFTEIGGVTGFNTFGGASGFLDEAFNFGSITGSFTVNGTTVSSYDVTGEFSNLTSDPVVVTDPIIEALTPGSPTSTFTLGAGNTATSSLNLDVSSSFDTFSFNLAGNYGFITPGDDPSVLFAGQTELISQFDFLLPLLPSNWDMFFVGLDQYTFTSGSLAGVDGSQGVAFYTTTAPEPVTAVLLGLGLLGLGFARKKQVYNY